MPDIDISQATLARLKVHRASRDTNDTVINRLLDAYERQKAGPPATKGHAEHRIDPRSLPDLVHTKVMAATLDRKRIARPNWNELLRQTLVRAMKRLKDFEELQKRCPVTIIRGERGDAGYRYLQKANISVQASDTNRACRALVTVAQDLGMALEIDFMWLQKEGAARPGERGQLTIPAPKAGT